MEYSRAKVKMRVSQEMEDLECRVAFVQERGWRKVGRGEVEGGGWVSTSLRVRADAESRVPMW